MATKQAAILALADVTCSRGYTFGSSGTAIGEVVFNTGMTGYQEVMNDPSYRVKLSPSPVLNLAIQA
jgi:carbamoyl-phosphate synthase small subunit